MIRLSRRKLAAHVSARLLRGDTTADVMNELAAYLIDTKRTDEVDLIVRDVESSLAGSGTVLARTISARSLSAQAKTDIEQYVTTHTGARTVTLAETIDPAVIGGVRIEFPGHQLDVTTKAKLERLTAQ